MYMFWISSICRNYILIHIQYFQSNLIQMLNKPCKERRSQLNVHSRISANFQVMKCLKSLPPLFTIKVECPSSCNLFAQNINLMRQKWKFNSNESVNYVMASFASDFHFLPVNSANCKCTKFTGLVIQNWRLGN